MALIGYSSLEPIVREGLNNVNTPEMLSVEQAIVTFISWLAEMQTKPEANPDTRNFASVTYNANGTVNASLSGIPFKRRFGEAGIYFEVNEYIKGDAGEGAKAYQATPGEGAEANVTEIINAGGLEPTGYPGA